MSPSCSEAGRDDGVCPAGVCSGGVAGCKLLLLPVCTSDCCFSALPGPDAGAVVEADCSDVPRRTSVPPLLLLLAQFAAWLLKLKGEALACAVAGALNAEASLRRLPGAFNSTG